MSNQKELKLSLSERVAALKLFDEFKGGLSQLAQILEDVKAFVVSDEEWAKAGLEKKPAKDKDGNAVENWNWKDEGSEKVLSLGQESLEYLRAKVKAKSDANELTINDKSIIDLAKKIN